jgi:hypothetical protein
LVVGGHRVPCPLTEACASYEKLSAEVEGLKGALDRILSEARRQLSPQKGSNACPITEDMAPEAAWAVLSKMQDEAAFVRTFNRIGEPLRRQVAEHILTKCNIFSGKGAIFSARYNNGTGFVE